MIRRKVVNSRKRNYLRNKNYMRQKMQGKDFIAVKDENKDGYIVLKQESLYKPLLIVFGIFLFVMIIIFPISIFDALWTDAMLFFRNMISWMSLSAVATLLPLPVSFSDVRLLTLIGNPTQYSNLYLILMIMFIVVSDTFFAILAYRFTKTLRKLFANKTKEKDEKKANERFKKYGNLAMYLGASTPLPFTLMVYTAGALKLPMKGFILAVFVGRMTKYALIAVPIRLFNFDLMAYGLKLWTQLLAGDLKVDHYIFIVISLLLIGWLLISIFRTIKKNKIQKKVT